MSNMLADGAEVLAECMDDFASSEITYARGDDSASMLATIGDPALEVEVDGELGLATRTLVFIVTVANLPSFVSSSPAVGDIITFNGNTYKPYPFDGIYVWENSDPYGKRIRIYTEKI